MDGLACNEQIYKGKEKEAVLEMLPYLRLGNLSDPNEMESVNFAQGPVCPVSFHPLKMVYSGLMKEADTQSSKNNFFKCLSYAEYDWLFSSWRSFAQS